MLEHICRQAESRIEQRLDPANRLAAPPGAFDPELRMEELITRLFFHADEIGALLGEIITWLENPMVETGAKEAVRPGRLNPRSRQ